MLTINPIHVTNNLVMEIADLATEPELVIFVLCEEFVTLPDGKVTINRAYDTIRASQFPARPEKFITVIRLIGGTGTHRLSVRLKDEQGRPITQSPALEFPLNPKQTTTLLLEAKDGPVIPKPGPYLLEALLDDKVVGHLFLNALHLEGKENGTE